MRTSMTLGYATGGNVLFYRLRHITMLNKYTTLVGDNWGTVGGRHSKRL